MAGRKDAYRKDPKWEEGLVSAAKSVAGSVQFLVKSANEHCTGKGSEAGIAAAAKSVAANAAQLAMSIKTKPGIAPYITPVFILLMNQARSSKESSNLYLKLVLLLLI